MSARLFCFALVVALSACANADCGLIPFRRAQIYEPNQRAIIAWNGEEEILILATDLRASENTKVLQIFPCRNEPTVKKADPGAFRRATDLINQFYSRQNRREPGGRGRAAGVLAAGALAPGSGMVKLPPAGFVAFHEQMGRHNIAVTEVKAPDRFVPWVEEFVRSQGADTPEISSPMASEMEHYVERGFHWFVYDIADVVTDVRSNEPIQYRFKTDHLFYPLKLTKTSDAHVNVEILVVTDGLLNEYPELPRDHVRVGFEYQPDAENIRDEVFNLNQDTLRGIDPDLATLMIDSKEPVIRRWTLIPNTGVRFRKDLVAK